ncbi:MAG TPA: lipid-binding SYLF domain-containing protein [Casimicrobiaceae bacterium]
MKWQAWHPRWSLALRMLCVPLLTAMLLPQQSFAQAEQRVLVTDAKLALATFINDPDMNWLQRNLGDAKAVLIAPRITKAGFIVGGSGGRAVAFARDPDTGRWAGPAFYTLATASVGFQAGIAVSEVVTLVMTDRGVNSLLSSSFKIGGDASVAAGPVGAGAQSTLTADLISFSRAKGVYGGLNLHGTIVSVADDWNDLYYERSVDTTGILIRRSVHNRQANELLNMLASAAKK